MFTDQEYIKFLSALKIDYQLYNELIKAFREITSNISNYEREKIEEYKNCLLTKASSKINLLMRTAIEEIRVACEGVSFLHFVSCNLSNYNKIIGEFEGRRIF